MSAAPTPAPVPHDFDFLHGRWQVSHRRLTRRLAGCHEWQEFGGTCVNQNMLGDRGNMDDNVIELPEGSYRAMSVRSLDPATGRWAIWWLDARDPHRLDPPVIGGFDGGVGTFYADDSLAGRPIRVRFRWTATDTASPQWEQAFSADAGQTWEINWTMTFVRAMAELMPT